MASFNGPKLTNPIRTDVPDTQEVLVALAKQDPTSISDIPVGAKRLYEASSGKWQWQQHNGSSWAAVPFLQHNVDQLDGYHAAITPAANTVAVRGTDGKLKDDITGNAATATTATTLSQTLPVNKGGTGATTSEAARSNLGVPPTSHASTATTYGVGNATQYGHLKLSDAANSSSGVSGGVAATPAAVKAAKDVADAAQSSANNAQSSADAAMTKASTLATASSPGIVKPGTGMSVDAAGSLNVSLNNTVTSTSTTQSATANAVKTAYDKAVEANDKAGIIRLFNSRLVLTSSNNAWTPPVTGWARITVIGGGGAGGGGGRSNNIGMGGGQGGTTIFDSISAAGGSGGGGGGQVNWGGYTNSTGGGGGGGAGKVAYGYMYLNTLEQYSITIGAGGLVGSSNDGAGPEGGRAPNLEDSQYSGGSGAGGASTGGTAAPNTGCSGSGGSGGSNGTGYGGGGGGATYNGAVGIGVDGGQNGTSGENCATGGGIGGPGAVIIEYYDPAKEGA